MIGLYQLINGTIRNFASIGTDYLQQLSKGFLLLCLFYLTLRAAFSKRLSGEGRLLELLLLVFTIARKNELQNIMSSSFF
jgi:hypothetical protein